MSSSVVIFEHPLGERIRNLLRLELLFRQAQHYLTAPTPWESRVFVGTLLDILEILARGDFKNELLKELERYAASLKRHQGSPGVDHEQLETLLRHIEHLQEQLQRFQGQLGQRLRDDPLIRAIQQRAEVPGGLCSFDLPPYHLWLEEAQTERQQRQHQWLDALKLPRQTIELILKMLRSSTGPAPAQARSGLYAKDLEKGVPYRLVRVAVRRDEGVFAEISGGKHRVNIRFLEPATDSRPLLAERDIPFRLSCCVL